MARELRLEDSLPPGRGLPSACGKTRAVAGRDFWDTPNVEASRVQPGGCWPGLEAYGCLPQQGHCGSAQAGMHWDGRTPGFSQHNVTQMDPTAPRGPVSVRNHVRAKLLQSCPTLCDPVDCSPPGSSVHGDSPGNSTGVGCHALLQGIFQTQGLNWCLLNVSCIGRQVLYHLRSPSEDSHFTPNPLSFSTLAALLCLLPPGSPVHCSSASCLSLSHSFLSTCP